MGLGCPAWNGFMSLGCGEPCLEELAWVAVPPAERCSSKETELGPRNLSPFLRVSEFMKMPIKQNEAHNGANAANQLLGQDQDPGLLIQTYYL